MIRQHPLRVVKLANASQGFAKEDALNKAGVLLFKPQPDGDMEFYLMRPVPTAGHPGGEPQYQIGKGTRHITPRGGKPLDYTPGMAVADTDELEHLKTTALREAREEMGLNDSNIARRTLLDLGAHATTSASSGKSARVYLYAAEIMDKERFHEPDSSTGQCKWIRFSEMKAAQERGDSEVRADHYEIISKILPAIKAHLAKQKSGLGI